MTKRMTRKEAGEVLFDCLAELGPSGLGMVEILDRTQLTPQQFENGKEYLRGLFQPDGTVYALAMERVTPYTYDPKTNTYTLDSDTAAVEEYWLRELKALSIRFQRLLNGTGGPAAKKFGSRLWTRSKWHVTYMLEDLDDIIKALV